MWVPPERNLDWSVDGMRGPGTGNVVHFDVAIDVAHKKIAIDVADGNAAFIHGFNLNIDVARNVELKVHLDDVSLVAVKIHAVVALAAKWAVHVELQQARLLGNVERDFFASLFDFVLRFCASGFLD